MLLLSLILATFIYILTNFLPFNINTLSFLDSFNISRAIFGILLSLKLAVHTIKLIYVDRKNPQKLVKNLILLILSLMVITFFYQIFIFIFSTLNVLIDSLYASNEKIIKISSELKILEEKNLKNSPEMDSDYSLNHHLKKHYPKIVGAKGSYLFTEDGREIFDAAAGAAVACIGYGNTDVIDAINNKYNNGTHYLASSY
jgi:hypothetical protein